MKKNTAIIFRVTGILFFVMTISMVLRVFDINIGTFSYIINSDDRAWSIFFLFQSLLHTTYFLFAIFATGTAAIFAGKNNWTQSVWNCAVYALIAVSIYTSLEIITGIQEEEQFFLSLSIMSQLFFTIIIFVCLKEESEFLWKNILPTDANSKICLKAYIIMLVLVETASFFLAH